MPTPAPSTLSIWNRALQLLGASRVNSLTDTSKNAVSCATCYDVVRDSVLEQHPWKFAIKLATLAADSPIPTFGRANSFTLPTDYICLAPDYEEDNTLATDYEVQNGKIYSNDSAPLYIRYVSRIENPILMPATFRELVSTEMAAAMCEELTQSNVKKRFIADELPKVWASARRFNARQGKAQFPPDGDWISKRV